MWVSVWTYSTRRWSETVCTLTLTDPKVRQTCTHLWNITHATRADAPRRASPRHFFFLSVSFVAGGWSFAFGSSSFVSFGSINSSILSPFVLLISPCSSSSSSSLTPSTFAFKLLPNSVFNPHLILPLEPTTTAYLEISATQPPRAYEMTPQTTETSHVNQQITSDSSTSSKTDSNNATAAEKPPTASEHPTPLSPVQGAQALDWAEMTEVDGAQQAAQPASSSLNPSAMESQSAKKARQKAKQKEKKASRKSTETASHNATGTQLPSDQTPETDPPATERASPADAQGPRQPSHPMNRSSTSSVFPGRGRGRGGYHSRGFSPVPAFSRGRGSFAGRGGGISHRARTVSVSPPAPVQWPNGIAPPTMPRAQREELERKRLAKEAAMPSSRPADFAHAPPSVTSESVPSRSGTATPATTATSSSPAPAQSFEDHVDQDTSQGAPHAVSNAATKHSSTGFSKAHAGPRSPSSFKRGRGGVRGARGRGGSWFRQSFLPGCASSSDTAGINSIPTHMHFGSVASSDDPLQASSDLAAPHNQEDNSNAIVQHPSAPLVEPFVPQQHVTSLPPGFAMREHSIVVDLRHGQPRQLGPWTSPEVQFELKQASEMNDRTAREPLPAHMRAIFGQSDAGQARSSPPTISTSIPASAALAAVFTPEKRLEPDALSEAGSNDSHDPTIRAAADGTLPSADMHHTYEQAYDPVYDPAYGHHPDMHGTPFYATSEQMSFAPPPHHPMYHGAEAYYPIPEQHMMQYVPHPSDAMNFNDQHHYQHFHATQQGYPMLQPMMQYPYLFQGEPVEPQALWPSPPPPQPVLNAPVQWSHPQE